MSDTFDMILGTREVVNSEKKPELVGLHLIKNRSMSPSRALLTSGFGDSYVIDFTPPGCLAVEEEKEEVGNGLCFVSGACC